MSKLDTPEKRERHRQVMVKYRVTHPLTSEQKEKRRLYMIRFRLTHPEIRRAAREKNLGDRRCGFCCIKLAADSVKAKSLKYCDSCRSDERIKRYLHNRYKMKWRNKKLGLPPAPCPLVAGKTIYFSTGRPPVKSRISVDTA